MQMGSKVTMSLLNFKNLASLMALVPLVAIGSAASAFPTRIQDCTQKNKYQPFKDILHNVNIVGKDGRGPLRKLGPKFEINGDKSIALTDEEIAIIEKSVGMITCFNKKDQAVSYAVASVQRHNGQVVTNSHVFLDRNTGVGLAKIERCEFENSEATPQKIAIDFKRENYILGTDDLTDLYYEDRATVLLERPVEGLSNEDLLQPQNAIDVLRPDQAMVVASGKNQPSIPVEQVPLGEAVAQACQAMRWIESPKGGASVLMTDCSGKGAMSGSVYLARNDQKKLVVVGIHRKGGKDSMDGKPYDGKKSYSMAVPIEQSFIDEMDRLNANREIRSAQLKSASGDKRSN